jgi:hypothetical protein
VGHRLLVQIRVGPHCPLFGDDPLRLRVQSLGLHAECQRRAVAVSDRAALRRQRLHGGALVNRLCRQFGRL